MKSVADGFGAWKSDGCSVYEMLDASLVTFNCTRLAGYAVLLVWLWLHIYSSEWRYLFLNKCTICLTKHKL